MSEVKPAIVLVHGAFAESASWNPVIARLQDESFGRHRRRESLAQCRGRRRVRA